MKPRPFEEGDLLRVEPRWGLPHAGVHRSESDYVHVSQAPRGEVVMVSAVSPGSTIVQVIRPDGQLWTVEKWDLSLMEES